MENTIKIRSINKIAYLKAHNIEAIEKKVELNDSGVKKVTYVFEDDEVTRACLDSYFLNSELKRTLNQFQGIKKEMHEILNSEGLE